MRGLTQAAARIGAARAAALAEAIVQAAQAELPAGMLAERIAGGFALRGRGLARRLAFAAPVAALVAAIRGGGR